MLPEGPDGQDINIDEIIADGVDLDETPPVARRRLACAPDLNAEPRVRPAGFACRRRYVLGRSSSRPGSSTSM